MHLEIDLNPSVFVKKEKQKENSGMYPKSGFTSVHFRIKDIQFSCVYPKRPLWEASGELCSELVSLLAGGLWCWRSLGTPRFCYRPAGTACA